LSVNFATRIASEDILDVLPNFFFLEELSVDIESISSRELTSVLQGLPQITTFQLRVCEFQGTPQGRLKTIQLNLRKLTIDITRRSRATTLHNALANIVEHSPQLVCVSVAGTRARKQWTTKLGDRIKHLTLYIRGSLPPISSRGLKYLVIEGSRDQSGELLRILPAICPISLILQFMASLPNNNCRS
jgi:hypothetical protein